MIEKSRLSCSVLICTRNRPQDIMTFLGSLKAQSSKPNELVVVDSSDQPLTEYAPFNEQCRALEHEGITVVYAHTRPGLTYQRNQAVARATSKILYFFDDDVILDRDYIKVMQAIFEANPHYAGGMGNVTNDTYKKPFIDYAIRKIFLLPRLDPSGTFTISGMPLHPYGSPTSAHVEVLGGCNMAYRRAIFARHHFDERLGGYGYMEDVDLSYRVSRYAPLFYNPAATLQHMQSPVSRDKIEANRAMFIRNYSYLFFKNIYPHARWRILPYAWSVMGLFVQLLLVRDAAYARGYARGLAEFYKTRLPSP